MQKWEYKVEVLNSESADSHESELNRHGGNGWMLVNVVRVEYKKERRGIFTHEQYAYAYLRRPVFE